MIYQNYSSSNTPTIKPAIQLGKPFPDGKGEVTAALTNLKLDIKHPLYRAVKNYQQEVAEALGKQDTEDTRQAQIDRSDRGSFRMGDLYKNK